MRSEETGPSNQNRHAWSVGIILLLLVGGWTGYVFFYDRAPILTLPDRSSLHFLDATKAAGSPIVSAPDLPQAFNHVHEPAESWLFRLWKRLPGELKDFIPRPDHDSSQIVNLKALVPDVLWFKVDHKFDSDQWRFFWVDDQGYETEARAYSWHPKPPLLAFEGCVPRQQRQLHLRVRERDGEQMAVAGNAESPGRVGKVVGDFRFRNPIFQKPSSTVLTPDLTPATAPVHGDKMVLARAVRSRVTSIPTFGMRFDMHLNDHESITSKYQLHDWVIEDTSGNIMAPINGRGHFHNNSQWWSHGLWSDSPVWKVRFIACRYLEKDFEESEKFVVSRVPVVRGDSTANLPSWSEECMVKGHLIKVNGAGDWGPGRTSFRVHISPPAGRADLILLSAVDVAGNRLGPDAEGHIDSIQAPTVLTRSSSETSYYVMFSNPPEGDSMSFTFGLEKAVPVEFTVRPEFEP